MSRPDETEEWLARAVRAAEALRGLRQRLLALHAELSAIRASAGVAEASAGLAEGDLGRAEKAPASGLIEQETVELPTFVWPAGRTPN